MLKYKKNKPLNVYQSVVPNTVQSSMKTIVLLALTFGLALADIESIRVRLTYKSIAYSIFNYKSTYRLQDN